MASRTLANLTAVISANNTKFNKGIKGANKQLSGFSKSIKAIGPLVAGAFSVGAIGNFAKESIQLAAQAEGIKRAFSDLNDPMLLDELRESVKGTVSDLELMKSAVKASNFKIPLQNLAMFFKFAQKRAIETGESVDYLVESITNGIARKSLPILDNLGLSATEVRDEFNKTGDMAQAVANIISREMPKAGDDVDTLAEDTAQLKTAFENLKVALGELVKSGGILDVFTEKIDGLTERVLIMGSDALTMGEKLQGVFGGPATRAAIAAYAMALEDAGINLKDFDDEVKSSSGSNLIWVETVNEMGIVTRSLVGAVQESKKEIKTVPKEVDKAAASLAELVKPIEEVDVAFEYWMANLFEFDDFEDWMAEPFDVAEGAMYRLGKQVADLDMTFEHHMVNMEDSAISMSDVLASAFAQIGSAFATSLGQVAAGTKTLEDTLADIAWMIAGAIGDILILVGLSTTPVGIGLVLAGLALKGLGAFGQAGGFENMQAGRGIQSSGNYFTRGSNTLYGNDIRLSNNYATELYTEIG